MPPVGKLASMKSDRDVNKLVHSTYNKIAQKYTDAYWDDTSDFSFVNEILSTIPKGGKVLDIGCGPGNFTQYIKTQDFEVEGIDISEKMLEIAKRKVPEGIFKQMDMRSLEYENNTFDFILSSFSLIHIPSNEVISTLKEWNRVLKNGGKLGLITQKGKKDQVVIESFMPSEKMFFNFFTAETIRTFLKQADFIVSKIEEKKTTEGESLTDTFIYTIAEK